MSYSQPLCLGITLCDQVIEDKRTNKKSLIGVFNDILAASLPAKHPCMFLVISLTNCLGKIDTEVTICRDSEYGEDSKPLVGIRGQIEGRNPLDVLDLVVELRDMPLAEAGKYTIEMRCLPDGERVAQRFFQVKQIPPPASVSR